MPRKHILTVTLPIPPSANHIHGVNTRARKGKRLYLTAEARRYYDTVVDRVNKALPSDWEPIIADDEWIILELHHFDRGKAGGGRGSSDLSNRHPLIHNGIKKSDFGIDDYFYLTRDISREYSEKNQRIVVRIWRETKDVVRIRRRRLNREILDS